jgi:hypothetical protein
VIIVLSRSSWIEECPFAVDRSRQASNVGPAVCDFPIAKGRAELATAGDVDARCRGLRPGLHCGGATEAKCFNLGRKNRLHVGTVRAENRVVREGGGEVISRDREPGGDDWLVRAVKFPLGQMVMTPGVQSQVPPSEMAKALRRHARGDWGDLDAHDRAANEDALKTGARLLSAYKTSAGVKFWIITEADRSVTTVLLPDEY